MAPEVTAADLIAALMERRPGLSLEDLARELGVPLRTVQRWAAARDPKTGPQWRYARLLLMQAGWVTTTSDRDRADGLERRLAGLEEMVAAQQADRRELGEDLISRIEALERESLARKTQRSVTGSCIERPPLGCDRRAAVARDSRQ